MRRAFTLIEAMIALALLGIALAIGLNALHFPWLRRESDYRWAQRNAQQQIVELQQARWQDLPPQQVSVQAGGWVQLSQTNLVAGSVQLPLSKHSVLRVDEALGRVQTSAAPGARLWVDYRFSLPDRGEAHTVPSQAPYLVPLRNLPLHRIHQVHWIHSGQRTPVRPNEFKTVDQGLLLSRTWAGRVLEVEYLGQRIENQIGGRFLDAQFLPSSVPTACKQLQVFQNYGPQKHGQLQLTLLKWGEL